jgi:hypothetical protein
MAAQNPNLLSFTFRRKRGDQNVVNLEIESLSYNTKFSLLLTIGPKKLDYYKTLPKEG